jgi:hypothetical protein
LTEKILDTLSTDPTKKWSIQDISKESEVNWESTKRHLDLLKKLNSIVEIIEEGKLYYQKIGRVESDTLFSIPISDESRKLIEAIYKTIKETCTECGIPLSKTLVQKIAVDFVDERYKEIPRGWYLYGEMLLLPFRPEKDYEDNKLNKEEKGRLKEICMDYKPYALKSRMIRKRQYEKRDKKLYLTKEELSMALPYSDLSDNYKKNNLRKLLNDFLTYCERREGNGMILAIVEDFCSQTLSLLRHGDDKKIKDAQPVLAATFTNVWNLVGTFELYDSLRTKFYDKELLDEYMGEKIRDLEDTSVESLDDLNEFKPELNLPEDELTKRLRELVGSGKELTPEEKKKRQKELETMTLSDFVRVYGLDKT